MTHPNLLTLNAYQNAARKTALNNDLNHFTFGLVAEAGEVAGVMQRVHRGDESYRSIAPGGRWGLTQDARHKMIAELGDTLWFLAMTADALDCTLEEVAAININKLASRQKRNVITGTGDDR